MTVVRRRAKKTAWAIVLAAAAFFVGSSVKAATVKETFESHGLLGTLAADCSKPPSEKTPYLVNRAIDADHVQLDRMIGRPAPQFTGIVDEIIAAKPNELAMSYLAGSHRYNLTVRLDHERMRTMEVTREDGEKQIADGRYVSGQVEAPWFGKCVMKIEIQSSPGGADKCIDVPNADFKSGKRLQMWDCNETAAQVFAFDALNGRLSIGGLCVESSGRGQRRDPVQLAPCSAAPNQIWKSEAVGDFYRISGINELCIDVPNHSKDNGTTLWVWECHTDWSDKWVLRQGLDLTFEEKTWKEGGFLREFDLTKADPKLCQRSCIDDHQCAAWDYRKPEGRANHQPHCWLVNKIKERKQGDPMVISGSVRAEAK